MLRVHQITTQYNIGICIERDIVNDCKYKQAISNIQSLSKKYQLKVYTQEAIPNTDYIIHSDPSQKMIDDYIKLEIDCFIRGINDTFTFQSKLKNTFGYKDILRLSFFKDAKDRKFGIGPVSAGEGEGKTKRLEFAMKVCDFFIYAGINPKIAVMSRCRSGSILYSYQNRKSWEESDFIVSKLIENGISARNVGIEIENAVAEFNYILVVNGITGNQIYRMLTFFTNSEILGVPAFFKKDLKFNCLYEDNSRNDTNYENHIQAAIFFAEKRKMLSKL